MNLPERAREGVGVRGRGGRRCPNLPNARALSAERDRRVRLPPTRREGDALAAPRLGRADCWYSGMPVTLVPLSRDGDRTVGLVLVSLPPPREWPFLNLSIRSCISTSARRRRKSETAELGLWLGLGLGCEEEGDRRTAAGLVEAAAGAEAAEEILAFQRAISLAA